MKVLYSAALVIALLTSDSSAIHLTQKGLDEDDDEVSISSPSHTKLKSTLKAIIANESIEEITKPQVVVVPVPALEAPCSTCGSKKAAPDAEKVAEIAGKKAARAATKAVDKRLKDAEDKADRKEAT